MRIPNAVGGAEKPVVKVAAVEAQRDNGRRERPVWVPALLFAASIIIVLFILAVMAFCGDITILQLCGTGDQASIPEEVFQPLRNDSEASIVPHSSWSLRPQRKTLELRHPTPYVVVKHTAGVPCSSFVECRRMLRDIQELHWVKYDQPEISYNFLIDSNGKIYEGRGWNNTNPSRSFALRCNVDVALIGNYVEHEVPEVMSMALQRLLEEGVATGMLAPDYRLLAHSQVKNTLSPGRMALREIAGWPHRCLQDCDQGALCLQPLDADADDSSSR